MSKLRRVSGQEAIQALEQLGFRQVRQRGSHVVLVTAEKFTKTNSQKVYQ